MYRLPNNLSTINEQPEAYLPGELVCHKRYGYRGVIVSVDPECLADDAWYYSNQTHPSKNQPWYHILVHNSTSATYAAHSNLEPDTSKNRVEHPLVASYFNQFKDGRYLRNDKSWPS